jgi:hypothetical protein
MTILGSLCLHASQQPRPFELPQLEGLAKREGHHVSGRYNGQYVEYYDEQPLEVLIPQRYKRLTVLATPNVRHDLGAELSVLDSQYGDARHLYKLNETMKKLPGRWHAVVNNVNTGIDDGPVSGAFYLMASQMPLYVALVLNVRDGYVQLVWATFDFKTELQARSAFEYVFYPMPTLIDRPLFVASQSLCSKWWRMAHKFDLHRFGELKACNALELNLYKDPTQMSFDHGLR